MDYKRTKWEKERDYSYNETNILNVAASSFKSKGGNLYAAHTASDIQNSSLSDLVERRNCNVTTLSESHWYQLCDFIVRIHLAVLSIISRFRSKLHKYIRSYF